MNLQIQNFCDSRRIKVEEDLLQELTKLPKGLAGMYSVMLGNISQIEQHGRSIAETALKWLLCAFKSSSTTIIAACSAENSRECRTLSVHDVLDVCSNLVIYDEACDEFRFAHLSVQEFLESQPGYTSSEANQFVARRSLQSLMNTQPEYSYTIWWYATNYWTYHYQKIEERRRKEFFEHFAKQFFFNGAGSAESSKAYDYWMAVQAGLYVSGDIIISHILVACRFEWLEVLDHYETYESSDCFFASANGMMNVAIRYGSASVVRWLLARKICPTDKQLELAIDFEETGILQIFMAEEIVSCKMLEHAQENLVIAVRYDLKDMYQAPIKKGANVNCRDNNGRTLLFRALQNSSEDSEILEDLLLKGVDPLARDEAGRTPLSFSILGLHQHTYGVSTDFDHEPSSIKDGEKILGRVLTSEDHRTACLLVRYGTDSMMRVAGIHSQLSILDSIAVLHILQSDSSVLGSTRYERQASAPDHTMQWISQTLLSLAALYCHEKAFLVLLGLGVDPTCPAIHKAQKQASNVTHHSLCEQQIEGGKLRINPNKLFDELRQGPLAWAAYTGTLSLVQSVLDQDMDPNIKNREGQTALYFAAQQTEDKYSRVDLKADKEAIVRLLLRKGAVVASADAYGGATVLAHALKARYSEIAQILLENGAQIPQGATGGPLKQLWLTFDNGREGIREGLLERVRAAQVNSLDLHPPISRFGWSGDPVDIATELILGGTMRVLGDVILEACGDISDPTQTELLSTQQ